MRMIHDNKTPAIHTNVHFKRLVCLQTTVADYCNDLSEQEQLAVASAIQKRRNEYSTGRWLVRNALAEFGINYFDLLPGENRQPVWPSNIVGSITHTDKYAATMVASRSNYISIGIDLEQKNGVSSNLLKHFLSAQEQRLYNDIDPTLLFSMKESCYKLLYPLIGQFIEFTDIEVQLDTTKRTFTVLCQGRQKLGEIIEKAEGEYLIFDSHWLTCMVLRTE